MRLRNQLLLLALVALVLPWAGWQFVRGLEERLREGQAAALADSAGALAAALGAFAPALPAPGPVWYLHDAERPIALDGDPRDWGMAWQQAQAFGPAGAPRLAVALARYGGAVHLFARVADATPLRHDASGAAAGDGDALRLLLDAEGTVQALRIGNAADGPVVVAHEGDAAARPRLLGWWRQDAAGYGVERRFGGGGLPVRLGIEAVDRAADGTTHRSGSAPDRLGGLWPLAASSAEVAARLATLVPPGLRARVLHPDGWVLAEAGVLEPFAAQEPASWQRGLYALLAEEPPALPLATGEAGGARGDALAERALLHAALSEVGRSRWSRPEGGVQLRLT